jgi:hypothetical protein
MNISSCCSILDTIVEIDINDNCSFKNNPKSICILCAVHVTKNTQHSNSIKCNTKKFIELRHLQYMPMKKIRYKCRFCPAISTLGDIFFASFQLLCENFRRIQCILRTINNKKSKGMMSRSTKIEDQLINIWQYVLLVLDEKSIKRYGNFEGIIISFHYPLLLI